jgi:hypothetical protein
VGARLLETGVPEHLLNFVEGPAGFEEPGAGLTPQVVEMQVDGAVLGAGGHG